jgi:hypothetical protein
MHFNEYLYILAILEAPRPGRQPKRGLHKKQYLPWLTEERMALFYSVSGIYGHVAGAREGGPHYIPQLHVTEKYIPIYSSVTRNRRIYFYILRY